VTRGSLREAAAGSARRRPARLAAFPAGAAPGSSLVADVAMYLAATNRRVLVLDWGSEVTAVEAQLHRVPGRELVAAELSDAVREALQRMFGPTRRTAAVDDPRARPFGRWWRHDMASLPGRLTVAGFTDGTRGRGVIPQRRSDELVHGFCAALRKTSEFDHILLVGGARGSAWLDLVVGVADVAVLPMAADPEQTRAEALELLGRRPDDLTLIGLPPGGSARASLGLAATAFAPPDFPPDSVHLVPTPHPAGPGVVPLAALQPPSPHDTDAARRISAVIAGRDNVDAPAECLRDGYLRAVGLPLSGPEPVFRLAYATPDRPEADELASWLRAANVSVRRFRTDGGDASDERVLALLSGHLMGDPGLLAALPAELDAVEPEVLEGAAVRSVPTGWRRIDLRLVAPEDRRSVVMGRLDLFVDGAGVGPQARPAKLLGPLPGRDPQFTGREDLLESLRDAFAPLDHSPPDRPCAVLVGAAGVGKTGLAAEYVHRFADAYTGVLWLPAQDESTRRAALAAVAREEAWVLAGPGLPHALLQARPEHDRRRWLVVFDGAEQDLPGTADLTGVADVLITTTSSPRPDDVVIVVDELDPAASAALLRNERIGVRSLTDAQVTAVIGAVRNLPIPLSLAAGALRHRVRTRRDDQVSSVVAQQEAVTSLVEAVGASTDTVERIVRIVVDALDDDPIGRLAVRLAELCAFLSSAGVSLSLLRSREMVRRLAATDDAGARLLADEIELDRVLATGARFGLFSVDWSAPPLLRMHRVLQTAVIALLPSEERVARRATVLAGLAELSPLEVEGPLANRIHRELRRHVEPSQAVAATTDEQMSPYLGEPTEPGSAAWSLRRWIVEQVGYTYRNGELADHLSTLGVVARLEPLWHDRYGSADPLRCRLADLHGGLLFKVGRTEDARMVDEGVLADLRRSLGAHHPRTVHSAGGLAGDLSRLGRVEEALPEAETVWAEMRATFGEEHPRTLAAAYNLAWARFLAGAQEEALNLHRRTHRLRRRVLGRHHLWFRESQRSLGFFLRECGLLVEARARLEEAELLRARDLDPDDDPEHLRVEHALAVTVRRAGAPARPSRVDATEGLVDRLQRVLGEDHPDALSAVLNWTAELAAVGRTEEAVRVADGCVPRMRSAVEDDAHPFVGAAMVDAALAHLSADDALDAVRLVGEAVALLGDAVADTHPWLLTAQLVHARALAQVGRAEPAAKLLRDTEYLCREYLPSGHPTAVAAATDADLLRQFGSGPTAAVRWKLLDIDIPPT
jgi:hypothetical protein